MENSADQGGWSGILQILRWQHLAFIHRGRRPRWITPFEICRILHILRKPNSIIALLFIQNIFPFLRSFATAFFVLLLTKIMQSRPQIFFGQRFNNLQRAAFLTSFWRHRFNNLQRAALLTSFVQYIWERLFPNFVNGSWLWWIFLLYVWL